MFIQALQFLISITFFALFLTLFTKLVSETDPEFQITLVFALFSLSISLGSFFWFLRLILLPPDAPIIDWLWFWRLSTIFYVLGATALSSFILIASHGLQKNILLFLYSLPPVLILISLFIFIQPQTLTITSYMGITNVSESWITFIFAFIILVYSLIPVYFFIRYIRTNPNKYSLNVRKSLFMIIAILLFGLINAFEFGLGLQILRIGILISSLIFLWVFLRYRNKSEEFNFSSEPLVP